MSLSPYKISQLLNSLPSNFQPIVFAGNTDQNSLFCAACGLLDQLSWVGSRKILIVQISDLSVQLLSLGKDLKIQCVLVWLSKVHNGSKHSFPVLLGSSLQPQHQQQDTLVLWGGRHLQT